MRSPDKLKTKYFFRRRVASKLCRVMTCGEEKPIMKSHGSDHVITRGHVSICKTNVLFYKAYTTRVGRVLTNGDRSHPWSHMTLWLRSLLRSYKKLIHNISFSARPIASKLGKRRVSNHKTKWLLNQMVTWQKKLKIENYSKGNI